MDINTKHMRSKSKLMILELGLENSKLKLQIAQQEKLSELGKLAITTQICYWGYDYADGDCQERKCERNLLCKARAEMLGGEEIMNGYHYQEEGYVNVKLKKFGIIDINKIVKGKKFGDLWYVFFFGDWHYVPECDVEVLG